MMPKRCYPCSACLCMRAQLPAWLCVASLRCICMQMTPPQRRSPGLANSSTSQGTLSPRAPGQPSSTAGQGEQMALLGKRAPSAMWWKNHTRAGHVHTAQSMCMAAALTKAGGTQSAAPTLTPRSTSPLSRLLVSAPITVLRAQRAQQAFRAQHAVGWTGLDSAARARCQEHLAAESRRPCHSAAPSCNQAAGPYLKVGLRSFSITAGSWLVMFLPNSSTTRGCGARQGWGIGWKEAALHKRRPSTQTC